MGGTGGGGSADGADSELPPTLRHQMDDWDERVRRQQLEFTDSAAELDERAARLRERMADIEPGSRPGMEQELRMYTEMAGMARLAAKIEFPIPDEGISVREDPEAPGGVAYAEVADVDPDLAEQLRRSRESPEDQS
ncbi:MAG TPA: hypothetical protein VG317_05120 [Pseudonocardiaceae bacterium]|jgi:hypothetical protein|nr:hypothetical protein [Pseudonocardiaceae bacterium]